MHLKYVREVQLQNAKNYTYPVVTAILIAIAGSILGCAIGILIFIAPVFIPQY